MTMDIIRVGEDDQERIFDFLKEHFYPDEPLNMCTNATIEKENCASIKAIKDNLSLIAVKKNDPNTICAAFINKEIEKDVENENVQQLLTRTAGTRYGKIMKFLDDVGQMSNDAMNKIWAKYDTTRAMDIFMISVRKENRRQNLAQQLMEKTIEIAQERKYRWISIGCTSAYSAAVAKKMGFNVVFELPYNEYKNEQGEIVFRTSPPHNAFCVLVKELPA